jgi:molybdate transport system substrate-binding protein
LPFLIRTRPSLDGRAMLAAMGLQPAAILGAVDTRDVAFLLATGAAKAGLLYLTEVRADTRLDVVAEVPADASPPISVGAALSHGASRPNPGAFLAFLGTPEATRLLRVNGLEAAA